MTSSLYATTQHNIIRTVLIIFPLILQTVVIAQMSTGGQGVSRQLARPDRHWRTWTMWL